MILFVGVGVCTYVSFVITSMLRVVFHAVSMGYFLSFCFFLLLLFVISMYKFTLTRNDKAVLTPPSKKKKKIESNAKSWNTGTAYQPRRARWWRKPGVGRIRSSGPGGNLGYGRTATRLLGLLLN